MTLTTSTAKNRSFIAPFQAAVGALCLIGTLMVTTQNSQALEYTGGARLQNAAVSTYVAPQKDLNKNDAVSLFGAPEQRFTDLRAFTKWNNVLDRFKGNLMTSLDQKPVQEWLYFIESLKGQSKQAQIEAVNQYMNQFKFVSDADNYGTNDYWATPMEFMAKGGDCEDYAIAKYVSLRALGFSKSELRLVIVQDRVMRAPHAMVAAFNNGKANIMDNQNPAVLDSAQITRYVPVYSISQVAWWRH